jgi:hypothetical protein
MPGSPERSTIWPVAVLGPGPALEQDAELVLAADQRREPLAVERLEAALGLTLALDLPGGQRLGEALDAQRAELGEFEQPAHEPACRLADDDAARLSERLQPRCEVRRLADHRLLLRSTLADQIADHHLPGRDPEARRQSGAARGVASDRFGELESGADRALGVVLVRQRVAEIGEHASPIYLARWPS